MALCAVVGDRLYRECNSFRRARPHATARFSRTCNCLLHRDGGVLLLGWYRAVEAAAMGMLCYLRLCGAFLCFGRQSLCPYVSSCSDHAGNSQHIAFLLFDFDPCLFQSHRSTERLRTRAYQLRKRLSELGSASMESQTLTSSLLPLR